MSRLRGRRSLRGAGRLGPRCPPLRRGGYWFECCARMSIFDKTRRIQAVRACPRPSPEAAGACHPVVDCCTRQPHRLCPKNVGWAVPTSRSSLWWAQPTLRAVVVALFWATPPHPPFTKGEKLWCEDCARVSIYGKSRGIRAVRAYGSDVRVESGVLNKWEGGARVSIFGRTRGI